MLLLVLLLWPLLLHVSNVPTGVARIGLSFLSDVVLAATHVGSGLMFHILCILFILALVGVFLHSAISMVMLQKRRRARLARHRDWHGSSQRSSSNSSESQLTAHARIHSGTSSEKPVEIKMGAEEIVTATPRGKNKKVIRQPPPIYGSFRGSKVGRI